VLAVIAACTYAIILLNEKTGSQVVLGILGIAGGLVGAGYQYRLGKEKEADARLFTEKQTVYSNLISTIFSLYQSDALRRKPIDHVEFARQLNDIRTSLVVWGSFQTLKALDDLAVPDAEQQTDPLKWGLMRQAALFSAIRSDLGHKDPPDAGLEIALGIIKGDERESVRRKLS
jgi:hypothetical protein